MGVVAFFAISGYVIVPTLSGDRSTATLRFIVKRFFRLYPIFWVAVFVLAAGLWFQNGGLPSPWTIGANLTMIPLELRQPQIMGHFWTLEVELIFYGIILILFWCNTLHREEVIAGLMLLLAVLWNVLYRTKFGALTVAHNMVWTFLSYFLSVMFWGSMVRSWQARGPDIEKTLVVARSKWPFIVMTGLVFGRPLIAIFFGSATVNQEDWRGTLLGLLLFLVAVRVPARYASPFVWVGTISYSVYLLHPLVFYPIILASLHVGPLSYLPLSVYILLAAVASVLIGSISYLAIEVPSNEFGHKIAAAVGGK